MVFLRNRNILGLKFDNRLNLVLVNVSSSSNSSTSVSLSDDDFIAPLPPRTQQKKTAIFSDRLLACLDAYKISNRSAIHLIAATASSFGINIENFILNYRSLHRSREKYRLELAKSKRNDFHVIFSINNY